MPSILGENLFDDFMNDFRLPAFPDVDKELYGKHAKNLMKTDVKETEKGYEVDMDLPGFKKDELSQIFCNNPWKTPEISRYHHSKYFFIGETILILTDAVYDRHTFFICFLRNLFCNIFPVSCCTEIQNHFL